MPRAAGGGLGDVRVLSPPPRALAGLGPAEIDATPKPSEAGFPFGSGARHTAGVPFTRALGAVWEGTDPSLAAPGTAWPGARMRLPCAAAVCDADGAVDLRAIVALLDHAGGSQLYAACLADGATATLELRVDIVGRPRPGQDVVIQTRALDRNARSVLVQGEAAHAGDALPLVRMTGRYVSGFGPGRASDGRQPLARRVADEAVHHAVPVPAAASFGELLGVDGLPMVDADFELPFASWRVGSVALSAVHGGVLASSLLHAAAAALPAREPGSPACRPVSMTVQFLRAALPVPTRFEGHCTKSGRSASYATARAHQHAGERGVATAQVLFA